jgi:hypothetical protein
MSEKEKHISAKSLRNDSREIRSRSSKELTGSNLDGLESNEETDTTPSNFKDNLKSDAKEKANIMTVSSDRFKSLVNKLQSLDHIQD